MFVKRFALFALGILLLTLGIRISAAQISASPAAMTPLQISTTSLPDGIKGIAYPQTTLSAGGGAGAPYVWTWAAATGSTLPAGLSLTTTGMISGTPTTVQTSNLVVKVMDVGKNTVSANLTLKVLAPVTITTVSPLPVAQIGKAYTQTLKASGGSGGYTWSLTNAPTFTFLGLTLSSAGVLSGTPLYAGTYTLNLKVSDSEGHSVTGNLSITVNRGLTISSSGMGQAFVGIKYGYTLTATGGSGTGYTWTALPGNNLATFGFTLSSAGLLSGTATTTGTITLTAQVKDSGGNTATAALKLTVYNRLALTPTLPSNAYVGQPYTGSIKATGGSGQYQFTFSGLAGGLTAAQSGAVLNITGTPTMATAVYISVTVKDTVISTSVGPYTYTVNVINKLVLPSANPSSLPGAKVAQAYTGSITATGGTGTTFYWMVNGAALASGVSLTLSNGLSASSSGRTLSIKGTPTTTSTVSFTARVADDKGATAGPYGYTIAVQGTAFKVSGNIKLTNGCGSAVKLPPVSVSINTNPVQTVTTDSAGNYALAAIPNGTYTITPSIKGAKGLFEPGWIANVVVNNAAVSGKNFLASVAYQVAGKVNYSGTKLGRVYVALESPYCPRNPVGVSLSDPTYFTIQGVPPGTYTLSAWSDTLGFGAANLSDPSGSTQGIAVSSADVANTLVTMKDPAAYSIAGSPELHAISAMDSGVAIAFSSITGQNPNGATVELPTSYMVQWSTSASFTTVSSYTFKAAGANGNNVWFLYKGMGLTGALTNGTSYYFRAAGVIGAAHGPWTVFGGAAPAAVKIGAPAGGTTVSGTVAFKAAPKGPLAVGFADPKTGRVYATWIAAPVSPQPYTVHVPAGSAYFFMGLLDQNKDGLIDLGDVSNTHDPQVKPVAISGTSSNQNLTLPGANSVINIWTDHWTRTGQAGTTTGYNVDFNVRAGDKLPMKVTLKLGPNVIAPTDIGICAGCGNSQFDRNLHINAAPKVGENYTIDVVYSDGTIESLPGYVTGVLPTTAIPTLDSPVGLGSSTTPRFDWNYPASTSSALYQFWLCCDSKGMIWQIPGLSVTGFTSSQVPVPLLWGKDPTDSTNKPTYTALNAGEGYMWAVQSIDGKGNLAQAMADFTTKPLPLKLPTPNPSTLPSAIVNSPYHGSIAVSGGIAPYTWTVSGLPDDGLNWSTSATCSCININGTPGSMTTTGNPVSIQVTVKDSTGISYGPVTYTIAVTSNNPVTLPPASGNPLGSAMVNIPYGASLTATGGAGGSHYSFAVNGTTIPTNNSYVTIANGYGLTAANNGTGTLSFAATPIYAMTVSLTVKVTNNLNTGDTATVTYSLPISSGPTGVNNLRLNGTYVCLTQGFTDFDGSRWAAIFSMSADANGHFWGVADLVSRLGGGMSSSALSGTYSLDADNNGLAWFSSTIWRTKTRYAISLSGTGSTAQEFHMVEGDDLGTSPSGQSSTATCYLANKSAFVSSTLTGGFVFGLNGEDSDGMPNASVGRFDASAGKITRGYLDYQQGPDLSVTSTGVSSGSYTTPDLTTGRSIITMNTATGPGHFVFYIIDARRALMLSYDTPLGAGQARRQQQSSYSSTNFSGRMVAYKQGFKFNSGSTSGRGSQVYQITGGASGMTVNQSYENWDRVYSAGAHNGGPIPLQFDSANPGRITAVLNTHGGKMYLYAFDNNSAFEMDTDGNGGFDNGGVDPQTQSSFTNANVAGIYTGGELPMLGSTFGGGAGEFNLNATGGMSASVSSAAKGSFTFDVPLTGSYSWDKNAPGTGGFLVTNGIKGGASCVVISTTRFACTLQTDNPGTLVFDK